jgi:hypothetical protein
LLADISPLAPAPAAAQDAAPKLAHVAPYWLYQQAGRRWTIRTLRWNSGSSTPEISYTRLEVKSVTATEAVVESLATNRWGGREGRAVRVTHKFDGSLLKNLPTDPRTPVETITVMAGEFECFRRSFSLGEVTVTEWHSTRLPLLCVKSVQIGAGTTNIDQLSDFAEAPVEGGVVYRQAGRSWTMTSGVEGARTHQRWTVLSVKGRRANVRFENLDAEGRPVEGASTEMNQAIDNNFEVPTGDRESRTELLQTPAGNIVATTVRWGDTRWWYARHWPGLLVKSESDGASSVLSAFDFGHDPAGFFRKPGNKATLVHSLKRDGQLTLKRLRVEVERVEDDVAHCKRVRLDDKGTETGSEAFTVEISKLPRAALGDNPTTGAFITEESLPGIGPDKRALRCLRHALATREEKFVRHVFGGLEVGLRRETAGESETLVLEDITLSE